MIVLPSMQSMLYQYYITVNNLHVIVYSLIGYTQILHPVINYDNPFFKYLLIFFSLQQYKVQYPIKIIICFENDRKINKILYMNIKDAITREM